MKKVIALAVAAVLAAVLFGGCGGAVQTASQAGDQKVISIGLVQIAEHPSLDTIRESFVAELDKNGYKDGENLKIDYQNAQNDQSNLKAICQKFVSANYDIIVAIATPAAQAAAGETKDIPILFSACTDPVASGLVADLKNPGGNVSGTSDAIAVDKIMALAKKLTPDIKTIGALYNGGETNSVSVIEDLKEYAAGNAMTVIDATVTSTNEVQQAVQSLAGKADAVFIPIDNTVASAMPVVAKAALDAGLPVYVGADSMVKDGGLATVGIDYTVLGQETAQMAIEVIKGAKIGSLPVRIMDKVGVHVNQATAEGLGLKIPQDVSNGATLY